TVLHYPRHVEFLWEECLAAGLDDRSLVPWLLLGDPIRYHHRMGDSPRARAVKRLFFLTGYFRQHLISQEELSRRAREADSGFFRHRADLLTSPYRALSRDTKAWMADAGLGPGVRSDFLDPDQEDLLEEEAAEGSE
ncbi:MAG: hypothetical protein ACYTAF_09020, partial [Planctomycetota bacterium]